MEREAPLFLEARTWKVLETIFDRKSSPALRKFLVKAVKFDPKTSQNRAQDAPKSRFGGGPLKIRFETRNSPLLGGVLGLPGGVLGASWARLGRVLGPSWGRLGSLGASWERLGAVLRRLGDVLGRISLPIQLECDF